MVGYFKKCILPVLATVSVLSVVMPAFKSMSFRRFLSPVLTYERFVHNGGAALMSDRRMVLGVSHDRTVEDVQKEHAETLDFQLSENFSKSANAWSTRSTRLAGLNASQWRLYWRNSYRHSRMILRGDTFPDILQQEPPSFLKDYKNPCWVDPVEGRFRCLPYFYYVGAPKAGSSDLYRRLSSHPEYARKTRKNIHWLTRLRFSLPTLRNFTDYVDLYHRKSSIQIQATVDQDNYHRMIIGDFSTSTLFDNDYWPLFPENRGRTEPLHTNSDFIHHLNPNTKIIITLRNPIERLYSGFLYFTGASTSKLPTTFHACVVQAVRLMNQCLETRSSRSCAYDGTLSLGKPMMRLRIGMYSVFVEDFLRVFPRDQIHIIRLEDHSKDLVASMNKVFKFLGMASLPNQTTTHKNSRREDDVQLGGMLEKTRDILYDFYRPYNRRLADLLNDERFNYGRR